MPASFSHQCTVQVKLELGHRAQLRKKPTTEGFTHDWMVFVRGPEQCEIQHFVEKVVFRLHDSFPKPKRGEWPLFPPTPPPPSQLVFTLRFWLAALGMPVRSCPANTLPFFDPVKVLFPPFCFSFSC